MDTIKVGNPAVKMIAHRGLSGIERENTNAAFVAAANRSYFGIETDLRKTTDGYFFIFHDDTAERVAGVPLKVDACSWQTLKELTLFNMQGEKDRQDLKIPLLQEYISICKTYDKIAVLELKTDFSREDIDKIVGIINQYDYLENTIFISFHLNVLTRIKEKYPNQKCQYLVGEFTDELLKTLINYHLDIDIYYPALTKEAVEKLHKANIKVNCWTVDSKEDANRLISYGVDLITTNILE